MRFESSSDSRKSRVPVVDGYEDSDNFIAGFNRDLYEQILKLIL